MIDISIPFSVDKLLANLNSLDKGAMLKEMASNVVPMIRSRVHVEGKDANGSSIGTYSDGYMKVRTGNYPGTELISGKNKGRFREKKEKEGQAGYFTKGKNKDNARPRHNRSSDTNVILSLTSQMEQDMQVIRTDNGYGIGYSNEFNYNKAVWNETKYKKNIWSLSVEESNVMELIAETYIEKLND